MENLKYRILENCDGFRIEILHETEVGFLWWKKKVAEWRITDYQGYAFLPHQHRVMKPLSRTFKSIDQALEQINDWENKKTKCSENKYHYVTMRR